MPSESPSTTANTQHLKRKCLGVFQAPSAPTYANAAVVFTRSGHGFRPHIAIPQAVRPGTPSEVPVPTSLITLRLRAALLPNALCRLLWRHPDLRLSLRRCCKPHKFPIETRPCAAVMSAPFVFLNRPQALVAFYACMRIGVVAAEHNPLKEEIHQQLDRHHGKVATFGKNG